MAEALPPEVERLASFGRALEGTVVSISLKRILMKNPLMKVPPLQAEKPYPQPRQICWPFSRRKGPTWTESVQDYAGKPKQMGMFLLKDGAS
jgi:hypothetical protein